MLSVFAIQPTAAQIQARYGMNYYQPKDWNREQPFLNVMKTSRSWISQTESTWDDQRPLPLDERGYVTRLEPGQRAATIMLTDLGERFPGGNYIFLYDGEGSFEWKNAARLISKQPGRQVVSFTPSDSGFVHLAITEINPDNYPRNMRFVREEFESTFEEQIFSPEFLAPWGDVKVVRFMDWMLANNSKQSEWSDRPLPGDRTYSQKGVPLELIVELMKKMNVDIWVNLPYLATDEYIRKAAELLRDTTDPEKTVYYEFSNEVWNGMFAQTRHAQKQGVELGLAKESWRAGGLYHSKDCLRMFGILDEVYQDQPRHRYCKVIATQGANIGFARIVVTGSDVYKQADALAIAPYLTFNVPMEKSQWDKDMPIAAEVETWSMDQVFAYLESRSLPQCIGWMDQQMAMAKELGLKLIAYEGGQHLTALGEANKNTTLVNLLAEANRDPRMGELYSRYFNHWKEIGGGVFCHFNAVNHYSRHGYWGLLEYSGQDPASAPKYLAMKKWAATLPDAVKK